MAAKDVKFGNDARVKMLRGVNVLADAGDGIDDWCSNEIRRRVDYYFTADYSCCYCTSLCTHASDRKSVV